MPLSRSHNRPGVARVNIGFTPAAHSCTSLVTSLVPGVEEFVDGFLNETNGRAAFVVKAHGLEPSRLAFEACLERISRRGPQVLEGLIKLSKTQESSDGRFDVAVLEEYFPSERDGNPAGEGVYAHELRWDAATFALIPDEAVLIKEDACKRSGSGKFSACAREVAKAREAIPSPRGNPRRP